MNKEYDILPYTFEKAEYYNVVVKPSTNKHKKIDVFKPTGEKIAECGGKNYLDYPHYLKLEQAGEYPKGYAFERRQLYKKRHKYDKLPAGIWANRLLW